MQILEKESEQKSELINIDSEVIQAVLSGVREVILNTAVSGVLKEALADKLSLYFDIRLKDGNISYNDKKRFCIYLTEHLEIVHKIVEFCHETRKKFGEQRPLRLDINSEKEDPKFFTISLIVGCTAFDEEEYSTIQEFGFLFTKQLSEYGILFYLEPECIVA